MKLADLEIFVVGNPPPGKGGRYFIFPKITTACGVVGYGEIYCATFSPHVVAEMAKDVFGRWFAGEDPHRIEHLWRATYFSGYTGRPDASLMGVFSGLEIALWDILGKAAGKPVHQLLGGKCRDRIRTYTYIYPAEGDVYPDPNQPSVYDDPDLAAARAADYLAQGFTALKFDPAGPYTAYDGHQPSLADLERSELFCKRLRAAVGTKADLLFGTHGQFTVSGAKRLARRLEPYDPLWFEEPTPPEAPERMAEVAKSTAIPVATGERLVSKYEFSRVLETGAASILQPALGRVGGLWEAKKVAALAEPYYAQVAPHLYAGPIEAAANIALAATVPNFLILEAIERFDGFHATLLEKPLPWDQGFTEPLSEPGLGVTLNETVARAHPYTEAALHLEPPSNPVD